jgi:hypothetical protein
MKEIIQKLDKEKFINNLFDELNKLPFGSLPKAELELVILHSIIEAQGGYDKLSTFDIELQRSLKLSQTKFKNKILEAQLRYDNSVNMAQNFLRKKIIQDDFSALKFDRHDNLILYISNPLILDSLKTFFDSKEIINDTSFNRCLLTVEKDGLLRILTKILNDNELECFINELLKDSKPYADSSSLINNLSFESLFSVEISLDPLKSAKEMLSFVRKILSFHK